MVGVIKEIVQWLKDNSISGSRKVGIAMIVAFILIGVNEYTGFLYYYPLSKEIEIINNIEEIKSKVKDNPQLLEYLNIQEKKVTNRSYLHNRVIDLFTKVTDSISFSKIETDKSPRPFSFWSLMSTSGIFFVFSILLVLIIIIYPFLNEKDKWTVFIGAVIALGFMLFFAWLTHYLWGLLPTLGRVWVNYILQILFQILLFLGFVKLFNPTISST